MSINPSPGRSDVFCDKFTVTTPHDNEMFVVSNFDAFMQSFHAERTNDSCFRSPSNGTLTWARKGAITWFTTSGSFLADLRAARMLEDYLCCFVSHNDNPVIDHAVSRMDVTVDEYTYAPTRVNDAYKLGLAGSIQFTRKRVQPSNITKIFGVCQYDDSGLDTGTVYMGAQAATFKAKMYDKRQQMLVTRGQVIPDTTRHEATATRAMGISLHDVARPTPLFYHCYPGILLSRPLDISGFAPSGDGYHLERREKLPAMALQDRVKGSLEVGALLRLAASSGEHGIEYLHSLIQRRYDAGVY
jgi:hypothetical protein